MRICAVTQQPLTGFDTHIDFELNDDSDNDSESAAELHNIAGWVSNTFNCNFVIIEHATRLIAGGTVDNMQSWKEGWNELEQYLPSGKCQLRCYSQDATVFLLKYKDNQ